MINKLKDTKSSFCNAFVVTDSINESSVVLKYYGYGDFTTLELPIKFYCKRFLKNSVDAFAVGSSAEKILNDAERLATEKF